MRIFEAYFTSIFLYNSVVWSLNKSLENIIDIYQRNLLRKILGIKWPYNISNQDLYEHTRQKPSSENIKKGRLCWVGHLLKVPGKKPARQDLKESLQPTRRLQCKPKATWISRVNQDLKELKPELKLGSETLSNIAGDREVWRSLIGAKSAMLTNGGMHN